MKHTICTFWMMLIILNDS